MAPTQNPVQLKKKKKKWAKATIFHFTLTNFPVICLLYIVTFQ